MNDAHEPAHGAVPRVSQPHGSGCMWAQHEPFTFTPPSLLARHDSYADTPAVTPTLGTLEAWSPEAGLPGMAGASSSQVTRTSTTSLAK